jgi:D-alanyl-D-alanine carboxypeptidase
MYLIYTTFLFKPSPTVIKDNYTSSLNINLNTRPNQSFLVDSKPPKINYLLKEDTLISAKSYLIYDLNTGNEISSFNKFETYPPASLVKVISSLLFISKLNLTDKYIFEGECGAVMGQKLGLKAGELVSGKDLLYSSLIYSAGDSVCQMQRSLGLSVSDLNFFASNSLNMKNSNFTNFIGLDYSNNYTTASDILKASIKLVAHPTLSEIVKFSEFKLDRGNIINNTNRALSEIPNSTGIKTGTTGLARENLIYRYTDPKKDQDFLIILLNSESRYQDIKNILANLYYQRL